MEEWGAPLERGSVFASAQQELIKGNREAKNTMIDMEQKWPELIIRHGLTFNALQRKL